MGAMPDFRGLAAGWVADYCRRGGVIEGPAVPRWIDRVGQQFGDSRAGRQFGIRAADRPGAIIDVLDRAMDRVGEAADGDEGR